MKIFLSYASKELRFATQIYLALIASGHDVFFDRKKLPPGKDYNSRIRKEIEDSDVIVFLISPNSVARGCYARTELKFAAEKWLHPANHVLPVMVTKTDLQVIPDYLKAVTILEPEGDPAAEISAWIARSDTKPLNISTWNVENAGNLVMENPSERVLDRRRRIRITLEEINPDVFCLVEGPKGEKEITSFCENVLNDLWVPVLLKSQKADLGERYKDYRIKGDQWIWFLVKPELADQCTLQHPNVWESLTGRKTWQVNYWDPSSPSSHSHSHYRHPQVMIVDLGNGQELELIGIHLKSRIKKNIFGEHGNLKRDYVEECLKSRVKLATEVKDIRFYIDARFDQNPSSQILVLGGCNDGPGKRFFELQYQFFDLISNLQGNVYLARGFLNHCLFDFDDQLCWSTNFRNPIDPDQRFQLIDHILISQPLLSGEFLLKVNQGAGTIEHQAYERANAGSNTKTRSSDHRPVSCRLDVAS